MPTFMFRSKLDGRIVRATADSLNLARDQAEQFSPENYHLYDQTLWPVWECWMGGVCIWHYDTDGNCINGPRPK